MSSPRRPARARTGSGREVVPIQFDHRRSAGHRLVHETGLNELLDNRTRMAGRDLSGSRELSPGNRLFEACEGLE